MPFPTRSAGELEHEPTADRRPPERMNGAIWYRGPCEFAWGLVASPAMVTRRCLLPVLLVAAAASGGCRCSRDVAGGKRAAARELRVAVHEPVSIDPGRVADAPGRSIAEDLFEGLFVRDPTGAPVAGLAEGWEVSPDGLQWTFTLRAGLVWSDGRPLGAEDFVWSWHRALAPATANPMAYLLWPISGARAVSRGDAGAVLGVVAEDARRLRIRLERPYPNLLYLVSSQAALPVPRHTVEAHPTRWTEPGRLVCNGPFVLERWERGQRMVLAKNPRYHAAEAVRLVSVELRFTTDAAAAWRWFRLGEVDWSQGLVPDEAVAALRGKPELRLDPYHGTVLMLLETRTAPMNDVRVRRALDLAIDRGTLTRQVLRSGEQPLSAPVPPSISEARGPARERFDPRAARALLGEVGSVGTLELLYNTGNRTQHIAEYLQRDLREHLGLEVRLTNVEWGTFLDRLRRSEYQMALFSIGGGFDPMEYVQMLETGAPDNRVRWSDPAYDRAAREAREARTAEERDRAIARALAVADGQIPMIPLTTMTRRALVRTGLDGIAPNPEDVHRLRWVGWTADGREVSR